MNGLNVGFVGTRFAGLDGVSLESEKLAAVLETMGHSVSWFGGRLGPRFSPGVEVEEASFERTENREVNRAVFGTDTCPDHVLGRIESTCALLQERLRRFVDDFDIDVLVAQNALAIPMQLPLGLAIARAFRAGGVSLIAHHHDFAWERQRFWPNAVDHLLGEAFPPAEPSIGHLTINSLAAAELERQRGVPSLLLPNVMDFDQPPPPGDAAVFKAAAGLSANDIVILQPTRVVPRKGIEDTLRLASELGDERLRVIVTHPELDEGADYLRHLVRLAVDLDVDLRVAPVGDGTTATLADAYAAADLVAYPSRIEGFGNALLEAFYYRRPVLVNRYPVYVADIQPRGVRAIEMDGEVTPAVVFAAARWLEDQREWSDAVDINYDIGQRCYSYAVAARILEAALDHATAGRSA